MGSTRLDDGSGHRTYLVLYRIKKAGGVGSPETRRKALTEELAKLNGERRGRFFEEAGHVSTSAWTVRVSSTITPNALVQGLKTRAKLSAGVDYLWAIQVVEPINEKHLTAEPMPNPGAKAADKAKAPRAAVFLKKIQNKP